MSKRNKGRKPNQPQRLPDPGARKTTDNAVGANSRPKRSALATAAYAIFEAIKRLFCKISQLIGKRHMNLSYEQILSELKKMQAELPKATTDTALDGLWTRLRKLCADMQDDESINRGYVGEFVGLYDDEVRKPAQPDDKWHCLNDLLSRLKEVTVSWKSRTVSPTSSRSSGGGRVIKAHVFSSSTEVESHNVQPISTSYMTSSTSDSQELEELRRQNDLLQQKLNETNAKHNEESANAESRIKSLENDLNEAGQCAKNYKESYESEKAKASELERLSIPKGIEGLRRRLSEQEHFTALPNDVKELLDGLLALLKDLSNKPGRTWFEQNLDRIRAYVYGTVDALPLLAGRGLKPEYFDDYYCLFLLQHEVHRELEAQGLSVICPEKGDMFRKDHHDFSDRDLVWVDDPSRDNQIEATRRVGFTFRDSTQKVTVLRKALVRRCVFSSESLQSDSVKTTIKTDDVQNDVAEPASDASFSADTEATRPSEQACPPDTPQPSKNCPEEELLTDNSEACPSDAEAPDAPRSVDDVMLDDVVDDEREIKG